MKKIHITTGEGIGLEVSMKALLELGPQKDTQFILWRHSSADSNLLKLIDKVFKRTLVNNTELDSIEKNNNILMDQALNSKPTEWVVAAAKRCLKDPEKERLVTGPLSKVQMQKDGFKEKGHTELLKKLSNTNAVFMCFLGRDFNVVLLTGHIPLKHVKWKPEDLEKCLDLSLKLKSHLPPDQQNKKLAVLGFNPHAGEEGLLGEEEWGLKEVLEKRKKRVEGPLVPDVAFLKSNWKKFHTYICLYHDQALIPFKMQHGFQSLQLSLGLPFVRTSVSHGTAKDIFGENQASPESMKQALLWAIK